MIQRPYPRALSVLATPVVPWENARNPKECLMRTLFGIVALVVAAAVQPARALVNVGALDTPGSAQDVEVVGGLAYLADGAAGLLVIDFGPEYVQPPEPIPTLSLYSQLALVASMMAVAMWRRRAGHGNISPTPRSSV
jgi:hypothetical protein